MGELSSLGATSPVATNLKWWIYLVLGQLVLWQLFMKGVMSSLGATSFVTTIYVYNRVLSWSLFVVVFVCLNIAGM